MPAGRPSTVGLKSMTNEQRLAYWKVWRQKNRPPRPRKPNDDGDLRRCKKCDTWKNREQDFYKAKTSRLGFSTTCRACQFTQSRNYIFQEKYGLSGDEYDELMSRSTCEICGRSNGFGNTLAIDHCHNTRAIRGILCRGCNTALGAFKDNITSLERAILYLQKKR